MNQPTDSLGRGLVYRNSLDCLLQTVRGEGFWGKNRFCYKSAILNFAALPARTELEFLKSLWELGTEAE
jgi:hypothetical protein